MTELGKQLIDELNAFGDALENGDDICEKFTCHHISLTVHPTDYTPKKVKETRGILNVSQSLFAQFLGVSVKSVRAWERGDNPVSGAARRLMDEIQTDQSYWRKRIARLAIRTKNEG